MSGQAAVKMSESDLNAEHTGFFGSYDPGVSMTLQPGDYSSPATASKIYHMQNAANDTVTPAADAKPKQASNIQRAPGLHNDMLSGPKFYG